jgi:hypothetical protein
VGFSRRGFFQGLFGLILANKTKQSKDVVCLQPDTVGWCYISSASTNNPVTITWNVHDYTANSASPVSWTTNTLD